VSAKRSSKPSDDTAYEAAASLREALRSFHRRSEQAARASGLTERTYQLLLMIKTGRADEGKASLRELEQRLQLGKSTVTELVLRAEEHELVERTLDRPRRREILIGLTREGERRLAGVFRELGNERARLVELLERTG
jgi:DNA-binding MarR family transcriptional regulator